MTTWTFNVAGIDDLKLNRSGIDVEFKCMPITDENKLQLLMFAQQLIFVLAEKDRSLVKKNPLVMSAKAIREAC
jgi:hypothetical protein